jgi:hypothetical protein
MIEEASGFLVPEPVEDYLRRRAAEADGDARWIIPGLLHRKLNVIYGLPTGGKSTWTYNLAAAYLAGTGAFMGRPVHVPGGSKRVAFITTDDDGADDAADAMTALGWADRVGVYEFGLPERGRPLVDWAEAAATLVGGGYGLVVVDNAAGLLGDNESTNADNDARKVVSKMRALTQAGLSVVLLTHSNNDGTFGGAGEWRKVARCIYGIHGRVPSDTRTVRTQNNRENLPAFRVRLDDDGVRIVRVADDVVTELAIEPGGQRRTEGTRHADQARLALLQTRDDWMTQAEIAEFLQMNQTSVSRFLRRVGHELRDGAVVPRLRSVA